MSVLIPKRISASTSPKFALTGKVQITIERFTKGEWVKGRWVDGEKEYLDIEANVQPLKGHELSVLKESDRTKDSIKVYSAERLRTVEEVDELQADLVVWEGNTYRAMKTLTYQMGVLNHTKTLCVRLPTTPQNMAIPGDRNGF